MEKARSRLRADFHQENPKPEVSETSETVLPGPHRTLRTSKPTPTFSRWWGLILAIPGLIATIWVFTTIQPDSIRNFPLPFSYGPLTLAWILGWWPLWWSLTGRKRWATWLTLIITSLLLLALQQVVIDIWVMAGLIGLVACLELSWRLSHRKNQV